ncbi:arsenate reductase family protein [Salinisphaera sp. Q1T1-3]|uniref:arsenate reductase family protein n=1 Tax=Salinisphaera sp. Q1T1-3 TaxID=2321229 RepID=UPI000E70DF78|nr:Spx/MgsR family RNA polymerase-binding regulatory protein [Salinisphaera sp. Q1T1-3]RJS95345.1 Spx/MgsR family RNA polymerase-binding regulatory protein [Salinisphaera sp. Q1T1-3]
MTVRLYGIRNCDSCRKARQWLTRTGIKHEFIDLRDTPVNREQLVAWREALGDDALINKRSQTWRAFDEQQREATRQDPIPVLIAHPTLIKRPILDAPPHTLAGFSAERYEAALAGAD